MHKRNRNLSLSWIPMQKISGPEEQLYHYSRMMTMMKKYK